MPHHGASPRGTAPLIITVLGGGFISGIIPAGLLPANVLNIEQDYGLSHAQMGRIVGLCMILAGGSGGLIGGWLCGKIGALRNVMLALVLGAASLGTIGLAHSLAATVSGLAGYFFAMGFMGSANALAAHMLSDRHRGISLLHASNAAGKLAGPMLALLFLYGAWRMSFLAAAVLPVVLVAPALLAHGNGDRSIGRKPRDASRAGAAFWLAITGFALIAGSEIAVALWIPAFGQKVRGFSPPQANALLSLFLLGMVSGRLGAGALSKKIPPKLSIGLCGSMTVMAAAVVGFTSYLLVAVSIMLLGLAFSAVWPSYFAHLSRAYPAHLGLMSGAAVLSTQIGFAACSYASGRLADLQLAYPIIFGAAVMAAFVVAFFVSPIGRTAAGE